MKMGFLDAQEAVGGNVAANTRVQPWQQRGGRSKLTFLLLADLRDGVRRLGPLNLAVAHRMTTRTSSSAPLPLPAIPETTH